MEGRIRNTGVMIHYVIEEVDRGEPVVTREVDIKPNDSLENLQVEDPSSNCSGNDSSNSY